MSVFISFRPFPRPGSLLGRWLLHSLTICTLLGCNREPTATWGTVPHSNSGVSTLQGLFGKLRLSGSVFRIDSDKDGKPEFATLARLIEEHELLWMHATMVPEVYRVHDSNYLLRLCLPEDTDLREVTWCAFAWPMREEREHYLYAADFETGAVYVWEGASKVGLERPPGPNDLYIDSDPKQRRIKPGWKVVRK